MVMGAMGTCAWPAPKAREGRGLGVRVLRVFGGVQGVWVFEGFGGFFQGLGLRV